MTTPQWIDERDFLGDSVERAFLAFSLKEGLSPEGILADWGDFDGDYADAAHNGANAVAILRDPQGMGLPSAKEVQTYYDMLNPHDRKIGIQAPSFTTAFSLP
jgi:hypothetical protein